MDRKSKILLWVIIVLILLSVAATFYKTVILQDFDITGSWIEIYEDSTYVWFFYDSEEYEIEAPGTSYNEVLQAISTELGISEKNLDTTFQENIKSSYEDALAEIEI